MWNWLRVLIWRIMHNGMINTEKDIHKCRWCGKIYLLPNENAVIYKYWNISGYYEKYRFCKYSHFLKFCEVFIDSKDSNEIEIYVVNQ